MNLSRRQWLKTSVATSAALCGGTGQAFRCLAAEARKTAPIDIGSRRELLVDDFLIERLTGAELALHKPEPNEVILVCDAPWEGNTSAYYSIFQDGDRFRMYYRGAHWDEATKRRAAHPEVACYAESRDGIVWTKPKLGLHEFAGSRDNNIVWTGSGTHNFTPMKDESPASAPDARYKALAGGTTILGGKKKSCLHAYKSPDGIRWSLLQEAVITDGAFDSQNLAFWDDVRGEYRAYWRIFSAGVRAIRTATSRDFIQWQHQADLRYLDSPSEHLYTNTVMPYWRAPHLFIGFPTRFQPKNQQVEPVFMTSRDGVLFRRWTEALIPITAPEDRDGNRSNYMTRGLLQLPGNDRELSVYATEAYYRGPASRVRRFTFRTDGFVSVHAPVKAELLTRPLRFAGNALEINCRTSPAGRIRVEIQDAGGRPLPKFSLADCQPIAGDEISRTVKWKNAADVGALAGTPVRLRFAMEAADLYALKFSPIRSTGASD